MNLLKNNNNLLKFSGTWTANSLRIQKTERSGMDHNKIGVITLTNIPTWLFDSPESVLVAEIPLSGITTGGEQTKTINLTAITGITVVVTVTYRYNGNQDVSGITTSLTISPATITYETLIGFDKP